MFERACRSLTRGNTGLNDDRQAFEMGRAGEAHRWRAAGRVVLFIFGCAVVLAATAPFASKLQGKWPEFVIGTVASIGTFALTMLFVRWERLRLEDVGAAPGRR